MTKTFSVTLRVLVAAAVLLVLYVSALSVYADVRGTSGRDRNAASVTGPAVSSPSLNLFTHNGGGISNSIGGTADSGGNAGGDVTTGDESVDVFVVNIGPTNSNTVVTSGGGEEAAEPQCTNRRSSDCAESGRGR